ncbi:hypothetical protein SBA2_320035 [Acidobacteriia bacterium SbA2]|nr:hypothetical protein SBA2_320035 [Acidobacteriia bacterium SbA2]
MTTNAAPALEYLLSGKDAKY